MAEVEIVVTPEVAGVRNEHGGCCSEVLLCNPGEFFLGDRKGEAGTSIGNLAASRE